MHRRKNKYQGLIVPFILFTIILFIKIQGFTPSFADDPVDSASEVTVGDVDYDQLTMKVYKNGNTIVYFSADSRKTWNEVEGESGTDTVAGDYVIMDISLINPKSDATVYFKGNKAVTAVDVVFPKASSTFKVKLDKATLALEFEGTDSATDFLWRKSTDYNWQKVSLTKSSDSYQSFVKEIENLRFKGCKLVFVCDQIIGTDTKNMGHRMSNESTVSIPKMANAPSVKVNVKKMNLNTKTTMEYFDNSKKLWVPCGKNMTITEIAPAALYSTKEGEKVTIKIRNAATDKKGYSKTAIVSIPGQTKAPEFGDGGHVKTAFADGKLLLTFLKASKNDPIDYCIIAAGTTFDESNAKWKTIKNPNKIVKLNEKSAPEGSKIYIRFSGVAENANKNIALKLPSYYDFYTVPAWPKTETKTDTKKDEKTNTKT